MMSNRIYVKFGFIFLTFLLFVSSSSISAHTGIRENKIRIDAPHLDIATRHDSTIYQKYIDEFINSPYGQSLGFTSPSQISVRTPTTYEGFVTLINSPQINIDLAWGGGPTLFTNLGDQGFLEPITDQPVLDWIAANITDDIAGAQMKLYNDQGQLMWVAAAISSFGFTVNNKEIQDRGLEKPTTWEDLASPDFFTSISEVNIGMGNAPDTTSNTRIYTIILQKFGWEKGWEILNAMAGNSKIYGGSVETRSSVISGETAVAMTIDFYGLIAQEENPDTEYVIPANGSMVNGDPIALTKNPGNLDAANAFMKFVLSQRGQALWLTHGINRLPVRADAFAYVNGLSDPQISSLLDKSRAEIESIEDVYNTTLENQGIDFSEPLALTYESSVIRIFEAVITNVHSDLRSTWSKMVSNLKGDAYPMERFQEIREVFGEIPVTEAEAQSINDQIASDSAFRLTKQTEWQDFALDKFDTVVKVEIPKPWTTVITSGNTTITSSVTPTTVDEGFRDIPFNSFFMMIALAVLPVLVRKFRIRR